VFELIDEREDATGTHWTVQVIDVEGGLRKTGVRLAWADYDVWCPDGSLPPMRIAEAVVAFALGRPEFDPLPETLDAAAARRRVEGADRMIADLLRS